MVELWLPYGRTEVAVRVPVENFLGVVDVEEPETASDPYAEVSRALKNPIGNSRLENLVEAGKKVAIVVEDETISTQNKVMLTSLLKDLNSLGVNDRDITIIVGCSLDEPVSPEKFGLLFEEDIESRVRIINHDRGIRNLSYVGKTTSRTDVYVNKVFGEADLRVLTGRIRFHSYAGYSGGRMGVLPAISGKSTIQHNSAFLVDPRALVGNISENPVHADMMEAAHLADVHFILNVVTNTEGNIIRAFAGDPDRAFLEGVRFMDSIYKVPVEKAADIAIVSPGGYLKDVNLYEACEAVDNILGIVREGGIVVLVAECPEGYGNRVFYDWMKTFQSVKEVEREIKKNFVLGGEGAYHLMKALGKVKIIIVSVMPEYYVKDVFRLRTAKSVNVALDSAFKTIGKKSRVLVVPRGSVILPILQA